MAAVGNNSLHNEFIITNTNAVDPASIGAVANGNTTVTVQTLTGDDLAPLKSTDLIIAAGGFDQLTAGLAVVDCKYLSASTLQLRLANGSAGAIDAASMAGGSLFWIVARR